MKGSVRKPRTTGGTWSYRLDLGVDARGQRSQKQVGGFATKREAQGALNDALSDLQHGTYVAPSRQTVGEFLDVWIEGARSDLAITAWTSYRDVLANYVKPHIGGKRLVDLGPMDVKKLHGLLLANGKVKGGALSVRSVQLSHRVLHRALADAVRWNLIAVNPASAVRAPRGAPKDNNVWSAEDAMKFLASVADHRLSALWILALHTGMRRGELAGLRWKDLDLAGATLTVAQQRTTAEYKVVVLAPKAKSQRQLMLAAETVAALAAHKRQQTVERVAAGPGWSNSGYVFVDELGLPYHPEKMLNMFHAESERAGVPRIRLHDVRHTMATLALQAGVHPKVVQEQLGHSTISVTMDTYSHVPQAVRRESASKIASLYGTGT